MLPGVQAAALGLDLHARGDSWSSTGSEFLNGDSLEFALRIDEADVHPSVNPRGAIWDSWDWNYSSVSGQLVVLLEGRELARSAAEFHIGISGSTATGSSEGPETSVGSALLEAYEVEERQLALGVLPASAGTSLTFLGLYFTVPIASGVVGAGNTLSLHDLLAAAEVHPNFMIFEIHTMRGVSPLWIEESRTGFIAQIDELSVEVVPEPGIPGLLGVAIVSACCACGRPRWRDAQRMRG